MSVNMGANSLLIVPAGFNPATGFGSLHFRRNDPHGGDHPDRAGRTGIRRRGLDQRPGRLPGYDRGRANGVINLNNGLVLSGNGSVNLGGGSLTVNDAASGISGGVFSAGNQYVGKGGTGSFTTRRRDRQPRQPLSRLQRGRQRHLQPHRDGQALGRHEYVGYSRHGNVQPNRPGATASRVLFYLGYNVRRSGDLQPRRHRPNHWPAWYAVRRQLPARGPLSSPAGPMRFPRAAIISTSATMRRQRNVHSERSGHTVRVVRVRGFSGAGASPSRAGPTPFQVRSYLGHTSTGSGTYRLSDGGSCLPARNTLGLTSAAGTFSQSGGSNATLGIASYGNSSGSTGTYNLGRQQRPPTSTSAALRRQRHVPAQLSGQLSAANEYVGDAAGATGLFQQTGGTNTASYLSIGSGGRYQLSGGTLQISTDGLASQGVFDGAGGTGTLIAANCIVDLSQGTLQNVGSPVG